MDDKISSPFSYAKCAFTFWSATKPVAKFRKESVSANGYLSLVYKEMVSMSS